MERHGDSLDDMFDIDGDGNTSIEEEALANNMVEELLYEDEDRYDDSNETENGSFFPGTSSNSRTDPNSRTFNDKEKKEKHLVKRKLSIIAACVLLAVFVVLIVMIEKNIGKIAVVYNEAEKLISEGDYDGAITVLQSIQDKHYHDTDALMTLCYAHKAYDSGSVISAYSLMKQTHFGYTSIEQQKEINVFKQTLNDAYDEIVHELAERRQREYERIQNLPFPAVGQYVTPSQYKNLIKVGRDNMGRCDVPTTVYHYISGDKKYVLYISDYNTIKLINVLSNRSSSGSSSGKKNNNTGPSVEGFVHPEDFYEWYYDDFVDYEDAEDYYYAHGGK